jgi:glycosyltransferase involved in cell wall biosynthesis
MVLHHASSKIVFIGQFPPPINGLTFITSRLESALKQAGYDIVTRSTTGKLGSRSFNFHLSRLLKTFRALLTIASVRPVGKSHVCYLTAEGGLGLIYSILIAAWARLLGFRLFIHHHSYSYIVRSRRLMTGLLAVSGSEAVHICLCSDMSQDLANCYRRDIRSLVVSNATFVDPGKSASLFSTHRDLVIGLLGNLTPEKGLYEFIDIVRIAKARALPIRGVLAGPIARDSDRIVLQSLKDELGEHLDYRGPVYHAEKARFFENIDVFVFPTTYLNEAQPTVIFEALANSVPIISFDRGCIRNQVGDAGRVLRGDANFAMEALLALDVYCGDPAMLAIHQHAARARYEVDRRAGNVQIAQLFDAAPSKIKPLSIRKS